MTEQLETSPISPSEVSEILKGHYKYLVVDPYAINLIDQGPRKGQSRLSFYSAFIVNAAHELMTTGRVDNIILSSDASFGSASDSTGHLIKSTGDLMKEALVHSGGGLPPVSKEKIIQFSDQDINSTPAQVRKLAGFLKEKDIAPKDVLYLAWDYHTERVQNHMEGYGISGVKIIGAVATHKYFDPKFNAEKLDEVLPYAEIEQMESFRRKLSRYDKKGRIPLAVKPLLGGGYTLDNQRVDGKLKFMYKPGKERLREVRAPK